MQRYLPVPLFVPVLPEAFFSFVCRHFMAFSFFTAWHGVKFLM